MIARGAPTRVRRGVGAGKGSLEFFWQDSSGTAGGGKGGVEGDPPGGIGLRLMIGRRGVLQGLPPSGEVGAWAVCSGPGAGWTYDRRRLAQGVGEETHVEIQLPLVHPLHTSTGPSREVLEGC